VRSTIGSIDTFARPVPSSLLRAAHGGPALAVTLLSALLALSARLPVDRGVLVVLAVFAGQLSVGWSNDLVDVRRDRQVGRDDKPLATGELAESTIRTACALAVAATVALSLACGWAAGLVHLALVAFAWAYNLGLKATVWSALPFALAFGGLPVFVWLADSPGRLPPAWLTVAAGLLGIAAHLMNVLPDLADDAATGVRGLPHRLGARASTVLTVLVLLAATVTMTWGSTATPVLWIPALVLVGGLAVTTLVVTPTARFPVVVAIALVDAVLLVVTS
jgi:4-hydroxybenzoate polyprenyltransferase